MVFRARYDLARAFKGTDSDVERPARGLACARGADSAARRSIGANAEERWSNNSSAGQ
jgi:hypothetical protein